MGAEEDEGAPALPAAELLKQVLDVEATVEQAGVEGKIAEGAAEAEMVAGGFETIATRRRPARTTLIKNLSSS